MRDALAVASALLWTLLAAISWIGDDRLSLVGMMAGGVLAAVYFVMGATVRGRIGVAAPLVFPMLVTLGLWFAAFVIACSTRGATESFILGLHPGQFWTILLFWLASFAAMTGAYAVCFDTYLLRDEDWEAFLAEVAETKNKAGDQ